MDGSQSLNAAQMAKRKIAAPKRRIPPRTNSNMNVGDSVPQFAPGASSGGLFGGTVAPANNGFNFAASVNPFANSVSFPPAVPGVGTPAKPDNNFSMSFGGQQSQPPQGGLFGNVSASFGGHPSNSNPFGASTQAPAQSTPRFSFGANNSNTPAANPFASQNTQQQPASSSFSFNAGTPTASAFNFGTSSQPKQSAPTPSFSFGVNNTAQPAAAPPSNVFGGFGKPKAEPAKTPGFNFGNSNSAAPSASASLFGSQPATREASPASFQFGAATPASEKPAAGPSFSFGQTAAPASSTPAAAPFSFGQTSTAPGSPKPAAANPFNFGPSQGSATPVAEKSAPFSFGKTSQTPTVEKPASFSFGQTGHASVTPAAVKPPGFSFGQSTQAPGSPAPAASSLFGNPALTQQETAPASNMFGQTTPVSSTPSFGFGTSSTPKPAEPAAPANNMFGQAKPANPFGNLSIPAKTSTSLFGTPSRSASPEKNAEPATEKPALASNLFSGVQTPGPTASTNLLGSVQALKTAPQPASSLFGKPTQSQEATDAPKGLVGNLPQPPKAAEQSAAQPPTPAPQIAPTSSSSLFGSPSKQVDNSLFQKPAEQQSSASTTSSANAMSFGTPAPKKSHPLSNVSNINSPGKSPSDSQQIAKVPEKDTTGQVVDLENQRQLNKPQEEVDSMYELYWHRAKHWEDNEFVTRFTKKKFSDVVAKCMPSNLKAREQLECFVLIQRQLNKRGLAQDLALIERKGLGEERKLKAKHYAELRDEQIMAWAARQVMRSKRKALEWEYNEDETNEEPQAKRLRITSEGEQEGPSPQKLLTNGTSNTTTPKTSPPPKAAIPSAATTPTPANANKLVQKRERISQTPKASVPLPSFATPSTVAPTPVTAPSPAPFAPAPASPAVETPTKSKRKAEKQFDKDDPFGEFAEAASTKKKQGSSTSNLFKSIVGKNPIANGTAPPTPERKILTPKKLSTSTTPKANPFGSLPAASSPTKQDSAASTPKANPFAALGSPTKQNSAAPAPKANPFAGLATTTKADTPAKATEQPKSNTFANPPKSPPKAATPAAAPATVAAPKNPFQIKTNLADAPKTSQSFQFKPSTTTIAPITGGFKPTVTMSFDSGDAFAKKAAAAKKKAANEAMERAKDDDWDEDDEEEEEWERKYWIRKAEEDKKLAEKAKKTTLSIPRFGATVSAPAASKPTEGAKDTSRSGTASPKSVLDSHEYGSGKSGGAAKNLFAHLSAATSPASSGKNDADDEDADDDTATAVKPGTGGSLFDRVSRPNSPAPTNIFGSVSKSSTADQTFKHDSPLKFAPSVSTSSNIFGAPASSAPSIFGSAAPSDAGTPKPNAFAGLFGSKPVSGTPTPAGAPKTSGFSFGAIPAKTETPKASGPAFAHLNEKKSETPIPPPKPFSFLKNPAATGITASTADTSRASTPGLTTEGENTDAGAESAEVDPEHVHEQLKDLATQPEAGEETLWMHKAKASQLKDGKWQQGIVGVFKVLKNRDSGKHRYIMRLDNGSVRMNENMVHTEPKATGKNVRMVLPSGIWAMTVKTPEVASDLVKVVNKAVSDF